MTPENITISLATDSDAPFLASVMTASFAINNPAWSLIWGEGHDLHDKISIIGLFTPIVKPFYITYKAVDSANGRVVGFAVWTLPQEEIKKTGGGGMPELPGVNMDLFNAKHAGGRALSERDCDATKDMCMLT